MASGDQAPSSGAPPPPSCLLPPGPSSTLRREPSLAPRWPISNPFKGRPGVGGGRGQQDAHGPADGLGTRPPAALSVALTTPEGGGCLRPDSRPPASTPRGDPTGPPLAPYKKQRLGVYLPLRLLEESTGKVQTPGPASTPTSSSSNFIASCAVVVLMHDLRWV